MPTVIIGARRVPALVIAAALCGCATLPDVREDTPPPARAIVLQGAEGRVPEARSAAILEPLNRASAMLREHLPYEESINPGSPLFPGNRLTLLKDGPETYASMFQAIRSARHSINLETYIFDDEGAGQKFAELLLERRRAGVAVNVIHDSIGSVATPGDFFERLRKGGVRVVEFNPVNPVKGGEKVLKFNNRDHRRQLIIDGRIAYTGGVNISHTYSSAPSSGSKQADAPSKDSGWRDTHLRIAGPAAAEFQKLFIDTWQRQGGEPLERRRYFPRIEADGDEIVRVISSTPENSKHEIFLTLMSAIRHSQRNLHLTIAYFAPDRQLREALIDAAQRGVDVKLVLPSNSDSWPVFNLGRASYKQLLRGGVKIYERRGPVMHAKTATIDGVWSTIGSANMDPRSYLHNDEMNAVILGPGFAQKMDAMFAADLAESDEITLEKWKHRPWTSRIKEKAAGIARYWL